MIGAFVNKIGAVPRCIREILLYLSLFSFPLLSESIDWQSFEYGRFAPVRFNTNCQPGFTLLPPEMTGIFFTNQLNQDRHLTNQILLNGSGLAAGDVDGDGLCDIYFCGLDSNNKLFKNLGDFKFADITEKAGVACAGWDCTGAVFADIDGDGDLDLIVNTVIHGTHIFFNSGNGVFAEKPCNAGLNAGNCGTSIALADIDGDGDLDLYIANYRPVTLRDQPNTPITVSMEGGKPVVKRVGGRSLSEPDLTNRFTFTFTMTETGITMNFEENGQPDLLCLNDGNGCFTPVSWTDGRFLDEDGKPLSMPPHDWGLTASFRDLNQDGFPDIYVCNDFRSPDRIWINNGKGLFRAISRTAIRQMCLSSMGADFADINRDGFDEIFSLDMLSRDHFRRFSQRIDMRPEILPVGAIENRPQYPRNMLQLNRGDGTYAEVAQMCGIEGAEWSWICAFIDVDLDGYEDILVPNGNERDNMNVDALQRIEMSKKEKKLTNVELLRLRKMFPRLATPNLAFKNLGNLKFEEVGSQWGFNAEIISQSIAFADLDNDGDLDVILNNLNTNAHIYRNNAPAPRVGIKLVGKNKNTQGIGARIIVRGGRVVQSQEMMCGGRYLAGDNPMRVFAAGSATSLTTEILWRNGFTTILTNLVPNRIYEINENLCPTSGKPSPALLHQPFFEDVSLLINHSHVEEPFDDFSRQMMLLNKLSQLGPGVAWFDINNDGADDLIIGSGRGGNTAIYMNSQNGNFLKINDSYLREILPRDQTGIVCLKNAASQPIILTGYSSYEDGDITRSPIFEINPSAKNVSENFPAHDSSVGHLAAADVDNDGWLDLFVAGRVIPGAYPTPASSMILLYKNNQWIADSLNNLTFKQIGMVNSAVFTDLDNDGFSDLVVTCDWGPIKIFKNNRGAFSPMEWKIKLAPGFTVANQPAMLSQLTGWWTGVTAGDFDGDGRMDIAVGNWGKNTKWENSRSQPIKLYYGDFDDNGTVDIIEAVFDAPSRRWVPFQPFNLVGNAIPVLRTKIGSFEAYARSSLADIYGDALNSKLKSLESVCLESCVFLNRGDYFEVRPLPVEAQVSPIFALCVADFDGDGIEDLFASQNFFAVSIETSRYDAGRGLLLKGNGNGDFTPVPGNISGILVYGEQRGAAVGDFNSDGRPDIIITQNANTTKLYKNVLGNPGLRIRLEDPNGNRNGIGAKIQIGVNGKFGPYREIHAGSGWFSQDSTVQILHAPSSNAVVRVQWQGNITREYQISGNLREIVLYPDGKIEKLK
ncbi:MAG: VCBS repeat-containing protein [Verrucomicrobiae bacterium]|nr:VCBS repeat-containing protein [Verrucomicrobiae bacterium]